MPLLSLSEGKSARWSFTFPSDLTFGLGGRGEDLLKLGVLATQVGAAVSLNEPSVPRTRFSVVKVRRGVSTESPPSADAGSSCHRPCKIRLIWTLQPQNFIENDVSRQQKREPRNRHEKPKHVPSENKPRNTPEVFPTSDPRKKRSKFS